MPVALGRERSEGRAVILGGGLCRAGEPWSQLEGPLRPARSVQNFTLKSNTNVKFPDFLMLSLAQMVKNTPAMQQIWLLFLGQEDPLEKRMATHSRIIAWRIPQMEKSNRLQSMGSQSQIQLNHKF